ncbi:MAG: DUF3187 family protein [Nitrospiraceae bacterium]|nr:DUF3187 family protein [Nitrospiraceae bacterium]
MQGQLLCAMEQDREEMKHGHSRSRVRAYDCRRRRILTGGVLLAGVFILAMLTPSAATAEGPLKVRNQFPLLIPVHPPYLESAEVRDEIVASLSHSSTYLTEASKQWAVGIDIELTELNIRLKKRIGDRNEIGLDVPVIRPSGGFFDVPLADWHNLLGAGDYGRHNRPPNSFLYQVLFNGNPVIIPKNDRSGLGDLRAAWKVKLHDAGPVVSLLVDAEAPTGDARTGYGNGSYDFGAALLLDAAFGRTYRVYANAGVVSPGDWKGYQTIPLRAFGYGGLGIEAAWWERFHVIVQTVVAGSPFPSTGIREIDWPGVLLTFGGRYSWQKNSVEFSLTEDPDTAGAPDFIANVSWSYGF